MVSGEWRWRWRWRWSWRWWRPLTISTSWVVRAKAVLRILDVYPSMKQFEKIAQIVSAWKAGGVAR